MSITIHWQMFPSTWVEGMPIIEKYQVISMIDDEGATSITQDQYGLLLAVSEEIHNQAETVPFIGTADGVKSFADLEAITTEV